MKKHRIPQNRLKDRRFVSGILFIYLFSSYALLPTGPAWADDPAQRPASNGPQNALSIPVNQPANPPAVPPVVSVARSAMGEAATTTTEFLASDGGISVVYTNGGGF